MSIRDEVSLSDQERKALSHLEARAAADDPVLAAHLRGRSWLGSHVRLPAVPDQIRDKLRRPWCGPVLVVIGVVVMVLALSVSVAVSCLGAVLTAVGLGLVAGSVSRRVAKAKRPPEPDV